MRSRTLPWPPVILAIMSLPQRTSQEIPPMSIRTIIKRILVIILRFFDTGFFSFLSFFGLTGIFWELSSFDSEACNSPLSESKSKT